MKSLLAAFLLTVPLMAQTSDQRTQPTPSPAPATLATTSPKGFVFEDATPIKMRINRTVSSADAHVGDTVDFEVLEDVK
jgi:hypothetical protein